MNLKNIYILLRLTKNIYIKILLLFNKHNIKFISIEINPSYQQLHLGQFVVEPLVVRKVVLRMGIFPIACISNVHDDSQIGSVSKKWHQPHVSTVSVPIGGLSLCKEFFMFYL